MKAWLLTCAIALIASYMTVAQYHKGDFHKVIAIVALLFLLWHIIFGICKGLFWLLNILIIADMKQKLKQKY